MSDNPSRLYQAMLRRNMQGVTQPAQDASNDQGIFGDTIDLWQRGVGQTFGGDAETLGQLTDSQTIKDAGRAISDWGEGQMQEVSPEMRAAMGKQFVVENPDGSISAGEAWADPRAYWGNFATVLGQFTGLIGGTKGAGVVAKPLIRGMANRLATDLVEGEAKRLVAKATVKDALKSGTMDSVRAAYAAAPTAVAKKAVIDKAVGQLAFIGYGAHAGAMASGMRAQQAERETRDYLNNLGPDVLNGNADYQSAYWGLADGEMNGADPGEIRSAAISYLSEQAASNAFQDPRALASDFASGLLTGAGGGIGGALGKVGKTRAGAAVRGFVGEGATEGWQGAETQRAVNEAVQEWADETRDPMAGVLVAGLNEAIVGGMAGGGLAGAVGPEVHINKPVVRTVTGNERIDQGIGHLDQRQAERGAAIEREIDTLFAGKQNPLGASDQAFDPVRDIPAYERQGDLATTVPMGHDNTPTSATLAEITGSTDSQLTQLTQQSPTQQPPTYRQGAGGFPGAFERDQRGILRMTGDVEALATWAEQADVPYITDGHGIAIPAKYANQAERAIRHYQPVAAKPASTAAAPTEMPAFQQADPIVEQPAFVRQSIQRAGRETDSVFGPLQSLRVTKRGKPFASQKEAQLASRADEQPVALNGGGFGIANRGEVEQAKAADQVTDFADRPTINVSGDSVTVPSSAEGAASQPQAEVRDEQIAPVSSISGEGQSDQPGAGVPTAAGAEPAIAGIADGAGAGDRADLAAPAPVPDGQQQDDQALTAPATDAGVVVSGRETQAETTTAQPSADTTTPLSERSDGTTETLGDGMTIVHGSGNPGMTADDIQIVRTGQKQGKKGRVYGGFYGTSEADAAQAEHYAGMMGGTPSVYDIKIKPGTKMLNKTGDITRLSEKYINELVIQGYGVVTGVDPRGQTEYVIIDKNAVESLTARNKSQPVANSVRQIEAARTEVDQEPTEAQKEAGNYRKGHLKLQGLDIALENPKGSTRSGTDQDGKAWQSTMAHDYGYIKRTLGADGDHVDVFIGDQPQSETVYVVDQVDPKTGKFDEHKVMMGFADEQAAMDGYLANYDKGWKGLGAIKAMPIDEFKRWVKEEDTSRPVDEAVPAKDPEPKREQEEKPAKEPERSIAFSKKAMAQGDKPATHLTRKEAELVAREWFKQYRGASGIDVQIHATQEALEQALGLDAKDGLIRRAAFDDDAGTLHVAADTISDAKRMREILRHEVLAHYGLANVLGDGEYTKLMSRLIGSQKDPSMKPVWDWVNTHYADEDIGTKAEEVVAHLAELEQGAWGRGWDRVVAWVTRALRAVGFVPDGITAAETRSLIEGLGKKLQRSGPDDSGPDGGKKFSQEAERPTQKGGIKMSQASTAADAAMEKLNLGPKPDIIDKTKASLNKLRQVDRGVVSSWIDRVIKKANTEVLDALAPIKYAEEAAGITDAADSGYVAARMATGAASTMQATMLYGLPEWNDGVIQRKAGTGEKDALLGIFADLGADLHNWLGWMAGHRAELLMAQGRENLLDANDIAALKGQGKGKEAKFLDAKARWNRLNAATLDLAQEAGLFTKEARAEFESEWYIPFFRESDDGDVIAPFKTKGIANQNSGIKKLKGGEANTNDLLENIFTSTSKLIDASMKNMAAQKTVWNLADTGIIEVIPKPNKMDYQALANGKDRIMVKLEGEDYMIRVEDPDLYRAMTFFDRKPFSAMVNVAAKAKRLLTAGVTASPEFMLRNFLRDSLSSWAISKDGFRPVIDSIKGVKKTLAMDGSTIDVMFSGASFLGGYVNGNDPEAMADTVRKSLRRKGMTPEQIARYEKSIIRNAAQAKGVVANVWEKYNRYGEAFENANREAVYAAAIKAGKSHAQAAFESKDLMDFSMLGASRTMQVMTQLLPFFNARVQGLGKLTRELRDNPRAIAKRAGMITAASLALLAANWDDERYEELPDWDKDANWHFFVGDQHFRIPKPFEIGVLFGTIPERMVRALGDKDTGAQFGKAVARAIGDTFALNPIPQIAKPVVETTVNYDFFKGGSIDGPQDLNVQAEARYNEQTSLLMRELGELTGFSPKQLEHLVIGYTGTMGSYVMAAADGLIRASRPGESASWRADEIPLVKAVYRGTGPAKSTQHMEEFYRMLNEVNQLKRTVDQYRSEGLTDKARELLEEQGGILKSRRSLSRTQQQVRVVRNKIELIQRDRTMSADEKRRRIDGLLSRRNDLVYQAVNKNRQNWE
ncbi:LPD38 domain-containing protein [Aeromonas caviae]|uniref:LPD38 domain-containing protein n=1 Tax=Aeromonas caviae TaxID=648 RepID=UPI0030051CB5